jgi:hypothetical protein
MVETSPAPPEGKAGGVLHWPPFSTTEEQIDRAAEILDIALVEAGVGAAVR